MNINEDFINEENEGITYENKCEWEREFRVALLDIV